MPKTDPKKKSGIVSNFFAALGALLCLLLVPILVINCTLIIKSTIDKDRVPTAFGLFPMIVLTNSMEPGIRSGDLVLCRTASPESILEGDIICYYSNPMVGLETVTHRVIGVNTAEDGTRSFITKGDANNAEDKAPVPQSNVVGKYITRFRGLGNVAMFMQTNKGILCCVVLPLVLLIVFEMVRRKHEDDRRQRESEAMQIQMDILRSRKQVEERLKPSQKD